MTRSTEAYDISFTECQIVVVKINASKFWFWTVHIQDVSEKAQICLPKVKA